MKVYDAGTLTVGSPIAVVVGNGGAGGSGTASGGAGASGRVEISWTGGVTSGGGGGTTVVVPGTCVCNDTDQPPVNGMCGRCPSGQSWDGTQCIAQCIPMLACEENSVRNSCTNALTPCPQYFTCQSGACIPPAQVSFSGFLGTIENGSTFQASGHLQARPTLVRQNGATTRLYWNAENVRSCAVTGSNGDSFTGAFSGNSGRISGPITGRTTFTLRCIALPGAVPGVVTEEVVVNIAPTFREL